MKIIEANLKPVAIKDFKLRSAIESDCNQLIDYDCLVTVNGIPKILYCKIDAETKFLRWAVKTIQYEETTRTSGLKTRSAIFGY